MTIAAGSIVTTDTYLGPIAAQLSTVAQQISGMGRIYTEPPEGPPESNSVMIALKTWTVVEETNAKIRVMLSFDIYHVFRRNRLADTLTAARSFVFPWLLALSAWSNQSLNGLSRTVSPKSGSLQSMTYAQQDYIAVYNSVMIDTEFNIITT